MSLSGSISTVREHKDFQIAQNSWREIAATVGKDETFVWFTSVTVLPDEDLRVKTLHLGCAHMKIAEKKNTVP